MCSRPTGSSAATPAATSRASDGAPGHTSTATALQLREHVTVAAVLLRPLGSGSRARATAATLSAHPVIMYAMAAPVEAGSSTGPGLYGVGSAAASMAAPSVTTSADPATPTHATDGRMPPGIGRTALTAVPRWSLDRRMAT